MLTPFEAYQQALATHKILPDAEQAHIINYFQALYQAITAPRLSLSRWHRPKILGIYLWGSVGIGKTWLMDLFFKSLPLKTKQRYHFHDFMAMIQDQLQRYQGQRDPLQAIAKQLAREVSVLCLDEFFVNDIGDAMILANLLTALAQEKIILITTANCAPEALYKNGLQRNRFIPAIRWLQKNLHILSLATTQDYRQHYASLPLNTTQNLEQRFKKLAQGEVQVDAAIYFYERPIMTRAFADNIIWFDFDQLCCIPRSQRDYLAIAIRFKIIILTNVPAIGADENNKIRYFINLIDILYDKKTQLILSSQVSLEKIYLAGNLLFEFARTQSRLIEMQAEAWA